MPTMIVTGGAGFIGSNLVRTLRRKRPEWRVINLDKLTYAGNLANLNGVEIGPDYSFIQGDICDDSTLDRIWSRGKINYIFHLAAETHVDRSLQDARPFVQTNVEGTAALLAAARRNGIDKFIYMSTDEVYGSVEKGSEDVFTEASPMKPRNPYAATKAAADLLCQASHISHGLPVVIVRAANNYGPYQYPEKFLPLMVTNLLLGKQVPIYGEGLQMRDWLFVEDTCDTLITIAERAKPGAAYNIAGSGLVPNIDLAKEVLAILKFGEGRLTMVADRPGHDFAYKLSAKKLYDELGLRAATKLSDGLRRTVFWYQSNEGWWRPIREGKFKDYYQKQYSGL
jgi:dTDP-glucose 4,6-dehydratase